MTTPKSLGVFPVLFLIFSSIVLQGCDDSALRPTESPESQAPFSKMRHPQLFGAGLTYGAKKPGVNGVVSGLPIATNNMVLSISTNVPEPARVLERY